MRTDSLSTSPWPALAGGFFALGIILSFVPEAVASATQLQSDAVGILTRIGYVALAVSAVGFLAMFARPVITRSLARANRKPAVR